MAIEWQEFTDSGYQQTKPRTAKAHYYYYIRRVANGYLTGYYGYSRHIDMVTAGIFPTADQARAYVERKDSEIVIIESVPA